MRASPLFIALKASKSLITKKNKNLFELVSDKRREKKGKCVCLCRFVFTEQHHDDDDDDDDLLPKPIIALLNPFRPLILLLLSPFSGADRWAIFIFCVLFILPFHFFNCFDDRFVFKVSCFVSMIGVLIAHKSIWFGCLFVLFIWFIRWMCSWICIFGQSHRCRNAEFGEVSCFRLQLMTG